MVTYEEHEEAIRMAPWSLLREGPCCERCGLPLDPTFAARTWDGFLCEDCYEEYENEKREAW